MMIDPQSLFAFGGAIAAGVGVMVAYSLTTHSKLNAKIKAGNGRIDEFGEALKDSYRAMKLVEGDRDRLNGELKVTRPAYQARKAYEASLEDMQRVWLDGGTTNTASLEIPQDERSDDDEPSEPDYKQGQNEEACEVVMRKNMWVWSPELIPTVRINKSSRIGLKRIVREHFGQVLTTPPDTKVRVNLNWKPDICGWFQSRSIQPGLSPTEDTYVIIELKHSDSEHNWAWMEQCFAYAYGLTLCVPELRGKRVECFVVCGKPDQSGKVQTLQSNLSSDLHACIRVTPLTYQELHDRAKQLLASTGTVPMPASPAAVVDLQFERERRKAANE